MKKHCGMRPQDIVVLARIITFKKDNWRNIDLANSLQISPSEVSEALNRCRIAKLIDNLKRHIHMNSFKEFIIYGLKYVFPVEPGPVVRGILTAHSAPPVNSQITSGNEDYVWPYFDGNHRGQAIEPLYKTVPAVASKDVSFHEFMAILDTIRIGRAREVKIAIKELDERLKNARD